MKCHQPSLYALLYSYTIVLLQKVIMLWRLKPEMWAAKLIQATQLPKKWHRLMKLSFNSMNSRWHFLSNKTAQRMFSRQRQNHAALSHVNANRQNHRLTSPFSRMTISSGTCSVCDSSGASILQYVCLPRSF